MINKYIITLILCLMSVFPIQASGHQEGGKVDAKEIVFHHVQDAYEWHITSLGDKHFSISLPIIVYSSVEVARLESTDIYCYIRASRNDEIAVI